MPPVRGAGFLLALLVAGLIGWGCYAILAQADEVGIITPFVLALVTALAAMGLSWVAIRKNVDIAGDHLLFDTWFPLAMAVVPVAGPLIALWSAIKLLRGRISAASITTSSGGGIGSTAHYDAVELGGHGVPAGILLVVVALTQPALAATLGAGDRLVAALDIRPIENTWSGSSAIECAGSQRHVARGLTLETTDGFYPIDARQSCSVELIDCDLTLHNRIFLQDRATLTVRGGRLRAGHVIEAAGASRVELTDVAVEGAIRIDGAARAVLRGGSIRSNDLAVHAETTARAELSGVEVTAANGVRASGQAKVILDGGSVRGTRALRADDEATIFHRGVVLEGALEGEHRIAEMESGESPDAAIERAHQALAEKRAREAQLESYRQLACSGIVECYRDRGVRGSIGGRVTSFIGPEGKATRAEVALDAAFLEIEQCVRALAVSRELPDFDLPSAKLSCRFSGELSEGRQRVMTQPAYEPVAELPPPADTEKRAKKRRRKRRR